MQPAERMLGVPYTWKINTLRSQSVSFHTEDSVPSPRTIQIDIAPKTIETKNDKCDMRSIDLSAMRKNEIDKIVKSQMKTIVNIGMGGLRFLC